MQAVLCPSHDMSRCDTLNCHDSTGCWCDCYRKLNNSMKAIIIIKKQFNSQMTHMRHDIYCRRVKMKENIQKNQKHEDRLVLNAVKKTISIASRSHEDTLISIKFCGLLFSVDTTAALTEAVNGTYAEARTVENGPTTTTQVNREY